MKPTRIVLLIILLSSASVRAAEPWDAPFAGNPQAILDAAKRIPVPESQPVLILLEQRQIVVDEGGRVTSRVRIERSASTHGYASENEAVRHESLSRK